MCFSDINNCYFGEELEPYWAPLTFDTTLRCLFCSDEQRLYADCETKQSVNMIIWPLSHTQRFKAFPKGLLKKVIAMTFKENVLN